MPQMEPLMVLGSSMFIFIVSLIAGFHLLPKLVPRSGILVGLEKQRYLAYENVFKFTVFTLFFGGLGVTIILEILKRIF